MKVLTDTHTLVWALTCPEQLGANAHGALAVLPYTASVANFWELILKAGKPDALVRNPVPWWEKYVHRAGIPTLPIRYKDLVGLGGLKAIHKDPFDRILVAQALADDLAILSKDPVLAEYGVQVIW